MVSKQLLLICTIILTVLISGCAQYAQQDAVKQEQKLETPPNQVVIYNYAFDPAELTVSKGDTVTWKQNDNAPHQVVSEGAFESKVMSKGDEFSFTFEKAGEYDYICSIHPRMKGKIIVK